MKFRILLILSLLTLIASSCRKNDNTPVADYGVNFKSINSGETVLFTDKSREGVLTWNWIFNGGEPFVSEEQNPKVTYNQAGVYSVSLTVTNAYGNNSLVKSDYITVVDFSCGNHIIDARDFNVYGTVAISNRCWLTRNLHTGTFILNTTSATDNSNVEYYCPNNDETNCLNFGGLYTPGEMLRYNNNALSGICPSGFIVPSEQIYKQLIQFAGGNATAGGHLKSSDSFWASPNTGASDTYGFKAQPAGYLYHKVFMGGSREALFLSATQDTGNFYKAFGLSHNSAIINDTLVSNQTAGSVRCYRNIP